MAQCHPQKTLTDRYTLRGDALVEARIASDMKYAADYLRDKFADVGLRAVVLLGGYGRGEGGALMENGERLPHNNYDLLMIAGRILPWEKRRIQARVAAAGRELAARYGIGVDLNICSIAFLRGAVHILINHDLRKSHKVLWGDPDVLSLMPQYDRTSVPLMEGAALMRNRGTCLLMNRVALNGSAVAGEEERRLFVRHVFKAVIGYGDAVLIAKGWYDTSYLEKLERIGKIDMGEVPGADKLKAMYAAAAEFRFEPVYAGHLRRNFEEWLDEVLAVLEPVHLWFERRRLGTESLSWEDHFHRLSRSGLGVRYGPLKRGRNAAVNLCEFGVGDVAASGGLWFLRHPRDRLLAAFPALMYRPAGWDWLVRVLPLLGIRRGGDWDAAATAYLRLYRRYLTA